MTSAARLRFTVVAGAILAVCAMEAVQHLFFMSLVARSMLAYHLVAAVLNVAVVMAVAVFYLRWRQAAADANAALTALRASEALREDMTSMLVHDLKNPLAAASGALQVILATTGGHDLCLRPVHADMLNLALESQVRLERMIEDILDVARAEEGRLPVNATAQDLRLVVREAVTAAATAAETRGVILTEDENGVAIPALFDVDKVHRIMDNLLHNAMRFTPRGGRIAVRAGRMPGHVFVTVSDTGQGVPEAMRERIFDKFAQATPAAAARMSVGLGLAFCRLAVEAQGGRIRVDDAPGGGAAFTFSLPATPGELVTSPRAEEETA